MYWTYNDKGMFVFVLENTNFYSRQFTSMLF